MFDTLISRLVRLLVTQPQTEIPIDSKGVVGYHWNINIVGCVDGKRSKRLFFGCVSMLESLEITVKCTNRLLHVSGF